MNLYTPTMLPDSNKTVEAIEPQWSLSDYMAREKARREAARERKPLGKIYTSDEPVHDREANAFRAAPYWGWPL